MIASSAIFLAFMQVIFGEKIKKDHFIVNIKNLIFLSNFADRFWEFVLHKICVPIFLHKNRNGIDCVRSDLQRTKRLD